jgi:putative membrane protein
VGPGMMGYYGGFSGGGILMGFIMLLFWILLIAGVVLLVRWIWDNAGGRKQGPVGYEPQQHNALEILKQRYAKGEISREEFQAMKQDLE